MTSKGELYRFIPDSILFKLGLKYKIFLRSQISIRFNNRFLDNLTREIIPDFSGRTGT